MAVGNITTISQAVTNWLPYREPEIQDEHDARLSASVNRCLMVLNALERLSILSSDLVDSVAEGESYEVLSRRLVNLHDNIAELSQQAIRAKFEPIGQQGVPLLSKPWLSGTKMPTTT